MNKTKITKTKASLFLIFSDAWRIKLRSANVAKVEKIAHELQRAKGYKVAVKKLYERKGK